MRLHAREALPRPARSGRAATPTSSAGSAIGVVPKYPRQPQRRVRAYPAVPVQDHRDSVHRRRVEHWRAPRRWRVSSPALSVARWVRSSTIGHVSSAPLRCRTSGFPTVRLKAQVPLKLTTALPGTIATALSLIPGYVGAVPGLTVASRQRLFHRSPAQCPGGAFPLAPPEP